MVLDATLHWTRLGAYGRGRAKKQTSMLAFVDPEALIPADHLLRTIKRFADAALLQLSPLFELYAADGQGRASIPPERLLKASLLISLHSVRLGTASAPSDEELIYHLLFPWFLDMDVVEPSFDHSTFSKNRARLLRHRSRVLTQVCELQRVERDMWETDG
jgi:transposase